MRGMCLQNRMLTFVLKVICLYTMFMVLVDGAPLRQNYHKPKWNEDDVLHDILQNQSAEDTDDIELDEDYSAENVHTGHAASTQHEEQRLLREKEQKEQMSFINKNEYRDYELDTTDTDQFNEEDDLLRKYYGYPSRRSVYDGFDSFSDLMHSVAGHSRRDTSNMKQLHYGLLNDEANYSEDDYGATNYGDNEYTDY